MNKKISRLLTEASIQEFSRLQQMTPMDDLSMEMLELAMAQFSKALAINKEELKGAAPAFAALGLQDEELRKLDIGAALERVAQAMSQAKDNTKKAACALAIFGKNGVRILPYLECFASKKIINHHS